MHRKPTPLLQSLRFRLIASVVTIEIVMLSLLVWNNISIIHTTHTDRLRDTATSMIQQIARTSGTYMVAVDYATLEDYLGNIIDYQELSYLVVLDRDEHSVIELGAFPSEPWPVSEDHPAQVTDGIFDISEDITVAGQPMGSVLMGFSLSLMDEAIRKSRIRGISIAAVEILLTVIVTVLIGLGLTRRLGVLAAAAQEVGKGDYSIKIPIETADEVGRTASAFNRMVTEVSNRTQQLEEAESRSRTLLAENRNLVHTSLHVQEEERKHLARELHDELGQCITAIQADAESIRDLSRDHDKRIEASASAILGVSSRIYEVVHAMMQRLRPGILDDLGLVEALQEEISAWQERNPDVNCAFKTSGDVADLGERTSITIYRIVQECLTNVAKYAKASQLAIDLSTNSDSLVLRIRDDGRGMDLPVTGSGLGLIGMRERTEGLGGEFMLESKKGAGVAISVTIPMNGREQEIT
ncbi:MAG: HAMP domain-containing protein [Gammaproteobacteria bacterium]|nr:MAG: HAMP domain-containing protein [Gammaproteobacteria bacterium]